MSLTFIGIKNHDSIKNIKTLMKTLMNLMKISRFASKAPTIWSCMKYCWFFWVCAPNDHLEMFSKLQKLVCRTVVLTLATSLEHLAHHCHQNVTC